MSHVVEKTVFTFAELSDAAKEHARDEYRKHGQDYEWWDSTYEDAIICAAKLGINIDTRRTNKTPAIYFSGFSSQGDGASYEGHYNPAPNAVKDIAEHAPQDEELKAIAEELTLLQITSRMRCGQQFCARVTTRSSYCHSGTMNVEVASTDGEAEIPLTVEKDLTDLLRRFADWIYSQLEKENEYLNSDECIDELLAGDEFDEDSAVI